MNCRRGFANWQWVAAAVLCFWSGASASQGAATVLRFDCGTADSPVAAGYERLTAEDVYSTQKGYGWEGGKPASVEFDYPRQPDEIGSEGRPVQLREYLHQSFDDLNRDGVVSESELIFRADVPKGNYRVTVTVGDMSQAIGSMDVYMNGRLAESRVAAWTPGSYRFLMKNPSGWRTYVRDRAEARDGVIRISLKKNQSYYDEQMAEQSKWENPMSLYWVKSAKPSVWNKKEPPYNYIGWPFVHNSVMAIEVVPDVPAPVVEKDGRLGLTRRCPSPALLDAMNEFNGGEFVAALGALERVREPEAQAARAIVQLWLAGRPEVEEEEKRLVPEAVKVLRDYVAAHPEESGVREVLQDAEIFLKALTIHLRRGDLMFVNGRAVQRHHFVENDKAIGLWWMIKEGSPLYYKSQLYIARAANMLLPYIPKLGVARQILEELEKKFPEDRYVRYFLDWEWENHGDGTHASDWYMEDYLAKSEGAPEWARQLQAAWATQVDWAEWWVKFKQRPEGNLGGGWGDDVEIVGAFGYMDFVSKGVSELCMNGMRKFMEGLWNFSEVDPELGYCMPTADVAHSAEWTGDTLGVMVQVDYGNPVWIERSMKTGKLMRDLWTGYNVKEQRQFRANYLGAAQVGSGGQMNEDWSNLRAIRPASAVLRYNQNPTIRKLFIELADAWLGSAMSTERGKPKGVYPRMVSFPEAIIGGIHSPNWYTAADPPEPNQHSWTGQGIHEYMYDLMRTVYSQTGDRKYFEPMRLQYELGARYGNVPEEKGAARLRNRRGELPWEVEMPTRAGFELVLEKWQPKHTKKREVEKESGGETKREKSKAERGSERWVGESLEGLQYWLEARRAMEGREGELEKDITRGEIIDDATFLNHMLRMGWPKDTTEAAATDRVGFPGWPHAFYIYTGGRYGGALFEAPVTYRDTTKYFAAAVMGSDAQGLRIIFCNMTPETREVGIVPWELEAGGRYALKYGPDADEDETMDSIAEEREFDLPQRGTPIRIKVEPNVTYMIEVDQIERGRAAEPAPDPGLSERDIRWVKERKLLLATIHNVGAKAVRGVEVEFYDGNPEEGGTRIGGSFVPNIEAPNDLEPQTVTVGVSWSPTEEAHEIYVVVDPNDEIKDEITTFNNAAHTTLPKEAKAAAAKMKGTVMGGRGRR